MLQGPVEEVAVRSRLQPGQERRERLADVADETQCEGRSPAQGARIAINLKDSRLLRIEGAIREIGAEHQDGVAGHQGVIAGREADQTGHAHVEGVVPFDVLLAAQGVDDRRFQPIGQFDQGVMMTGAAAACQNGDGLAFVQQGGQAIHLVLGG